MSASDDELSASAASAAPADTSPRQYSIVTTILKFTAAIAVGIIVAAGIQHMIRPATVEGENAVSADTASAESPSDTSSVPIRPSLPAVLPVLAPKLSTAIIVGSSRFDNPGQIALPTDSVFEISLGSGHSGQAEVYAINPEGKASHIWTGRLQAGQDQRTPKLRLQGMRGTETLRIVFKADDAPAGQRAATVVKQINILHV